jgi:RNA 2',3'-cyclic 3'-phosphodiesterase
MRLFFALEPRASTAMEIADWRERNLSVQGNPVPPQNFHITLAFLGEHSESTLGQLIDYVDAGLQELDLNSREITLDQVGFWHKAGIYWVGPSQWPEELNRLAEKLNHAGMHIGGKKDRNSFQPHITLFRRCESAAQPTSAANIRFEYDGFSLFQSRAGKHGVSYHSLCDWVL